MFFKRNKKTKSYKLLFTATGAVVASATLGIGGKAEVVLLVVSNGEQEFLRKEIVDTAQARQTLLAMLEQYAGDRAPKLLELLINAPHMSVQKFQ